MPSFQKYCMCLHLSKYQKRQSERPVFSFDQKMASGRQDQEIYIVNIKIYCAIDLQLYNTYSIL